MDTYKIIRVISGTKDRQMVTVKFENKTVTRHIIDGFGRHPDDKRPKLQSKMLTRIQGLRDDIAKLERAEAAAQTEVAKKGRDWRLAQEAIPLIQSKLVDTRAYLAGTVGVYEQEVKENPLQVQYTA
jgi:hypothetical protein